MTEMSLLMQAISTLLWPALVLLVVVLYRKPISEVIETIKTRGFTLTIGGQKLSVEEANDQHRKLIGDLQQQVVALWAAFDRAGLKIDLPDDSRTATPRKGMSMLWVDDNPRDHSSEVQLLADLGFAVRTCTSTKEALQRIAQLPPDLIITDMDRSEDGRMDDEAGMNLLLQVQKTYPTIKFAFVTDHYGKEKHAAQVLEHGAKITTSSTELLGIVKEMSETPQA